MGVTAPVGRMNADGSAEVWFRGFKFTYPAGDGKPSFKKEKAPTGVDPAEAVKWSESELTRGRWLVVIEDGANPRLIRLPKRSFFVDTAVHRLAYRLRM